jgi:hypothetical protein
MAMNDLEAFQDIFADIEPFSGTVPKGFVVDFLGQLTEAEFRTIWLSGESDSWDRERHIQTETPTLNDGEGWFEIFNWIAAAREARGSYVMMTLGACYAAQAVGSYLALQKLNPMPARLVAVEGVSDNIDWVLRQFRNNGIDPDEHWIIEAVLSDNNQPVIFPVGGAGLGNQSAMGMNSAGGREQLAQSMVGSDRASAILNNIITTNGTGVEVDLVPDVEHDTKAELRFVSAVTLNNLLAPFDRVDFVEADIQMSEVIVFPPAMEQMSRKVRRVHMGTHTDEIHDLMVRLYESYGWEIIFSYPPKRSFETPYGSWTNDDGVLTAVNPAVAY